MASPKTHTALVSALIQQMAWIDHWQDDLAHGLRPTRCSLAIAKGQIKSALVAAEEMEVAA